MRAQTTIKLDVDNQQALVALLKFQASKITQEELTTVLRVQGRNVNSTNFDSS